MSLSLYLSDMICPHCNKAIADPVPFMHRDGMFTYIMKLEGLDSLGVIHKAIQSEAFLLNSSDRTREAGDVICTHLSRALFERWPPGLLSATRFELI